MAKKYGMRLEDIDLWEVYDLTTDRVIMIAGCPYDGMAKHEAEEIVALLESGEITPDGMSKAPREHTRPRRP